jgi:hypothetical protein
METKAANGGECPPGPFVDACCPAERERERERARAGCLHPDATQVELWTSARVASTWERAVDSLASDGQLQLAVYPPIPSAVSRTDGTKSATGSTLSLTTMATTDGG